MQKGYHYKSCGLPNVWLRNGYEIRNTAYGKSVAIKNLEGLHSAIGSYLVLNKPVLSGEEIRFLRKELDLSQSQLGNILGVSEPTIRGWENNRHNITTPAERLLRGLYQEYIEGTSALSELIERIGHLNRELHNIKIELHETVDGWSAQAA